MDGERDDPSDAQDADIEDGSEADRRSPRSPVYRQSMRLPSVSNLETGDLQEAMRLHEAIKVEKSKPAADSSVESHLSSTSYGLPPATGGSRRQFESWQPPAHMQFRWSVDNREDPSEEDSLYLNPDHPLMTRYQETLKTFLIQALEKYKIEKHVTDGGLKKAREERKTIANHLLTVSDLYKGAVETFDKTQAELDRAGVEREEIEDMFRQARAKWEVLMDQQDSMRVEERDLRKALEMMQVKQSMLEGVDERMLMELQLLKSAEGRVASQKLKTAIAKKAQDMLIDNLTRKQDDSRNQILTFKARLDAQKEEVEQTRTLKMAGRLQVEEVKLMIRRMRIDWGMAQKMLHNAEENVYKLDKEKVERTALRQNLKFDFRSACRALENQQRVHERMQGHKNTVDLKVFQARKRAKNEDDKVTKMYEEWLQKQRILEEEEQKLQTVLQKLRVKEALREEYRELFKNAYQERYELRIQLMRNLEDHSCTGKGTTSLHQRLEALQNQSANLNQELHFDKNRLAGRYLDLEVQENRLATKRKELQVLHDGFQQQCGTLDKVEVELSNAVLEERRGLVQLDILTGKRHEAEAYYKSKQAQAGPLQHKLHRMEETASVLKRSIKDIFESWRGKRNGLLQKTRALHSLSTTRHYRLQESAALRRYVQKEETRMEDLAKEVKKEEDIIMRMGEQVSKLHSEKKLQAGVKVAAKWGNVILQDEQAHKIRELESATLRLASDIEGNKAGQQRLALALLDRRDERLFWEKRLQTAQEARETIKTAEEPEMHHMKQQIHHMEVRLRELLRVQEKVLQDMEKGVGQRAHMYTKAECRLRRSETVAKSKEAKQERAIQLLQFKVEKAKKESAYWEQAVDSMRVKSVNLKTKVELEQEGACRMHHNLERLKADVQHAWVQKMRGVESIVAQQNRVKTYEDIKKGKVKVPLSREPQELEDLIQEQMRCREAIVEMLVQCMQDCRPQGLLLKKALHIIEK